MYKKYVSGFLIAAILSPYTAFAGDFAPMITFNGGGDLTVNLEGGASLSDVTTALGSTVLTATDDDAEEMTAETNIGYEALDASSTNNYSSGVQALIAGSVDFSQLLPTGMFPLVPGTYTVNVTVSDSALEIDTQTIVLVVNTTPDISTNGDNTTPLIIQVDEDQLFTATSTITDLDGHTTSFTAHAGVDAEFFSFDTDTGVLTSLAPFNFEDPQDQGGNGIYRVILNGQDEYGKTTTQTIRVEVVDVANEPVFSPMSNFTTTDEGQIETLFTFEVSDPQEQEVTLSLDPGAADSSFFTLTNSTTSTTTPAIYGATLEFVSPPDFEAFADTGRDNFYNTIVIAEDTDGNKTLLELEIFVSPVNDIAPVFVQLGGGESEVKTILNNDRVVTQLLATDGDIPFGALAYTISGGEDAGLFQIVPATKRLRFIALPAIGTYEVSVQVSDGIFTDTQDITVTVLDSTVNYAPEIVNNDGATTTLAFAEGYTGIIENINATDLNGDTKFWTISGPDYAHFNIVSNNGRLQLLSALNYEAPVDADSDNIYEVLVSVSDYLTQAVNPLSDTQTYLIEVTDVEERPDVSTTTLSVVEGTAPGSTWVLTGTDPQLDYASATQATTTDAGYFTVTVDNDADTIRIDTNQSFDYENPLDANEDNFYELTFDLLDLAGNTRQVVVTVEVTNVSEFSPVISSGAFEDEHKFRVLRLTLEEGETFVYDLEASDGDGEPLAWSIIGEGDDGEHFTVASSTGVLEFATTTLFAAPVDEDGNNVYEALVEVSDGNDSDLIEIFVTIVADTPSGGGGGGGSGGGGGGGSRNLSVVYDEDEYENQADDVTADTIQLNNPTFEQDPESPDEVLTTVGVTVTNTDGTTETQDVELITTIDEDGEATTVLADPSQAAFILGAGVNALTWIALVVSLMAGIYLAYIRFMGTPPVVPIVPPTAPPKVPVTPPTAPPKVPVTPPTPPKKP